jgi:hypothetical protein
MVLTVSFVLSPVTGLFCSQSSRGDLGGGAETEIFFQTGLGCPNQLDPVQQIRRCAQAASGWLAMTGSGVTASSSTVNGG